MTTSNISHFGKRSALVYLDDLLLSADERSGTNQFFNEHKSTSQNSQDLPTVCFFNVEKRFNGSFDPNFEAEIENKVTDQKQYTRCFFIS